MKKTQKAELARRALDERLSKVSLGNLADRPTKGWIRAIRDALGMTSRQLANILGTSQAAVTKLEQSEVDDSIRLSSLRKAAAAMDATLIYAIIPRSTLTETVQRQAEGLARRDIRAIDQTMRLEDQGLGESQLEARVHEYAAQLIASGRLWENEAATE